MSEQEINNLKQMLASNNEADINLAGSIISGLPDPYYEQFKKLLIDRFKEEHELILKSEFTFSSWIDRYLKEIFYGRTHTNRDVVLWTSDEGIKMFDQVFKKELAQWINKK